MSTKRSPLDIIFNDVTYNVTRINQKEKKQVLKGVNGCFKSGELTGILGPSGAGKSSLLNILTGFTKSGVDGDINISKKENNNEKHGRRMCSYILQDDNLFPLFTVQETMEQAADLKLDNVSIKEKQKLIAEILNTLNLTYAKQTRCSNLSGGQKKRLSIALELLDNPPVLFLDEPTTGLDSSSSAYCVRLLKDIAREGRTIVCTIHQPSGSIYDMFDHIYVMAEGRCVYQGSPNNTVPFLTSTVGLECPRYHNVADYLLDVCTGEYGNVTEQLAIAAADSKWRLDAKRTIDLIDKHSDQYLNGTVKYNENGQIDMPLKFNYDIQNITVPGEWKRLWILMKRCQVQLYRDWTVTHLKLLLHVVCAVLIGQLYGDSGINASKTIANVGFLIVSVFYLWYTTLMPGILRFPGEINILRKEVFNNWYKLRTYYIAAFITAAPIHITFSTIFAAITFFTTSQPFSVFILFKYVLTLVLITGAADSLGILLGTIFNPVNGTFMGAIISCYLLAFSGFLVMFPHMPKLFLPFINISVIRYAFESLVLVVYNTNKRNDIYCPEDEIYCHYKSPKLVLDQLGMGGRDYYFDIAMIVIFFLLWRICGYFTLKRRMMGR